MSEQQQTAREIVFATALGWSEPEHGEMAQLYASNRTEELLAALDAAGYRLAGPGEVTVDRERWERVLADAREWSTQMRGKNWGPGAESQPGDLDPVQPDPQPSLSAETMLEALFELDGWVHVVKSPIERPVYSIGVFVDGLDGTDERFDADDWRSALRAAYVAVTQ